MGPGRPRTHGRHHRGVAGLSGATDLGEGERRLRPRRTDHGYLVLRQLAAALEEEAARVPPGLLVDLGCGARPYAPLFRNRYVGLDLTASHGRPDVLAAAEHLPLRAGAAEVVLSTQHLEHAPEPDRVLAEAARVLGPGGVLLVSTHGVWPHHPDPHDYWRWTEEGLRRLVEVHGFEVVRVHRQGEVFGAGLLLAAYPLGAARRSGRRAVRAVAGAGLALVNTAAGVLDRAARRDGRRHLASANYLVVARRT